MQTTEDMILNQMDREDEMAACETSKVVDALLVILLTPDTREYLKSYDPKALEQAEAAIKAEDAASYTRLQEGVLRLENPYYGLTEKESFLLVAARFIEAGFSRFSLTERDLQVIGINNFMEIAGSGWEGTCSAVYKTLTGKKIAECTLIGRGFRSQFFAKEVATAIRAKAEKLA